MSQPAPTYVVLVAESVVEDEMVTLRALARTGLSLSVEVERAGDSALVRFEADFAESPPHLLIVSDGLLRVRPEEVVLAVRLVHAEGTLPILHLLAGEGAPTAQGASRGLVKPIRYEEYIAAVGAAAREMLSFR